MKYVFSKFIFIFLILFSIISFYIGYDIDKIKIWKIGLFQLGLLPAVMSVFFKLPRYLMGRYYDPNKYVIKMIVLYTLYQIIVILPLTYIESNLTIGDLYWSIMPRLYFLLIPFIYWFVLPSYNNPKVPINWIAYSSIILVILILYNYSNGIYSLTNTGELRLVSGTAAMLFAFTLITKFSLFSHDKNNPLLIAISMIGFVFVNHRSAYIMLGVILLLSIFIGLISANTRKLILGKVFVSLIIILLLLITLSQIPMIRDNFIGRVESSFDVEDKNAVDRMTRWEYSFNYFLENPINGSKLENKFYADNEELSEFYAPHNFVFEILSTQGIVGFIFISLILFNILKIGYRNKNDNISNQMFLVVIFYILFSLMNVTILNSWNILILVFSSAVILYRNNQLRSDNG